MADSELSEIEHRHKKERKELQAQIQKIKHEVPKGDKKRKKEATEKIAKLEAELDKRHQQELEESKGSGQGDAEQPVSSATAKLENLTAEDDVRQTVAEQGAKSKKPSKAQKRREKKAALDKERNERIQQQEVLNLTGDRHVEYTKIKGILGEKGLQIYEIPSDGNCLYNAICHQLKLRGTESSNESLRSQTADYIRKHQDDFLPFLTRENGDCYDSDDFSQYCTDLETTPAWGGQLEIQALSKILEIPVEVIQADGPPIVTGEQFPGEPLILTYYRHAYGLGEHYHSVIAKTDEEEEDGFT